MQRKVCTKEETDYAKDVALTVKLLKHVKQFLHDREVEPLDFIQCYKFNEADEATIELCNLLISLDTWEMRTLLNSEQYKEISVQLAEWWIKHKLQDAKKKWEKTKKKKRKSKHQVLKLWG